MRRWHWGRLRARCMTLCLTFRNANNSANRWSISRRSNQAGGNANARGGKALAHPRAAVNAEDGLPSVIDSSVAKCFANEICREVTGAAVQLMGGYGYSKAIRWSGACVTRGGGVLPAAR